MAERDDGREYRAIMRALAESVADASDTDILEEGALAGGDLKGMSEAVRNALLDGLRAFRKTRLTSARAAYERDVDELENTLWVLPDSVNGRRELLKRVFEEKPEFGEALLTAQHREFRSLSDEDVESCLRELQFLGVIPNPRNGE